MSQEHIKNTLLAAMGNLEKNPAGAKVVFRASTQLDEGMHCLGKVREFPPISIDEPADLGGSDRGPNPVEIVLVALGTCQEIVYRAYASVMGIALESVKCNVRGYLDLRGLFGMQEGVRAGYQKIVFETEVVSSAARAELEKLAQIVERHCPVLNTLQEPVEVTGSVTINGQQMAAEASASV
ncbi:putative redox protein [Hyphomicrobium sp. 1Nfss2.1]|uniref:OsmC family protein n=1 Tax=Hyphomicrobium sp. 1Nfss2.1 TaxID=3413936 RepID=UPI003C7C46CA